jgi:hypothetical protein
MPAFPPSVPAVASGAATLWTSTTTPTVAATVTETTILGPGSGSLTLPANYLTVGKMLRLTVRGLYSTPALAVGNILVNLKVGSVTIASATATALLVSATNAGWEGTALITCRSAGSSGTLIVMGAMTYGVGPNLAALTLPINNGASTSAVDTTSAQTVNCTVTWSNNTAGNSISALVASLEGLN